MNYYDMLNVPRDATPQEIRKAYRLTCKQLHPDAHPSAERKAWATRKMQDVNSAYAVLSDPDKRREYDRQLGFETTSPGSHNHATADSSGPKLRIEIDGGNDLGDIEIGTRVTVPINVYNDEDPVNDPRVVTVITPASAGAWVTVTPDVAVNTSYTQWQIVVEIQTENLADGPHNFSVRVIIETAQAQTQIRLQTILAQPTPSPDSTAADSPRPTTSPGYNAPHWDRGAPVIPIPDPLSWPSSARAKLVLKMLSAVMLMMLSVSIVQVVVSCSTERCQYETVLEAKVKFTNASPTTFVINNLVYSYNYLADPIPILKPLYYPVEKPATIERGNFLIEVHPQASSAQFDAVLTPIGMTRPAPKAGWYVLVIHDTVTDQVAGEYAIIDGQLYRPTVQFGRERKWQSDSCGPVIQVSSWRQAAPLAWLKEEGVRLEFQDHQLQSQKHTGRTGIPLFNYSRTFPEGVLYITYGYGRPSYFRRHPND